MVASAILVTGANRGIGLELVRQLTDADPRPRLIVATCRDPASAVELNSLVGGEGDCPKILVRRMDVTIESTIDAVHEEIRRLSPSGLNLLINNAGVFPADTDFGFESVYECFRVNAAGPLMISTKFRDLLKFAADSSVENGSSQVGVSRAAIVMITGRLASIANTTEPRSLSTCAYKASKAALNMIAKNLSVEFAADGILVTCVTPGAVKTRMGFSTANLSVDESVRHILATLESVETGKYHDYDYHESGRILPW